MVTDHAGTNVDCRHPWRTIGELKKIADQFKFTFKQTLLTTYLALIPTTETIINRKSIYLANHHQLRFGIYIHTVSYICRTSILAAVLLLAGKLCTNVEMCQIIGVTLAVNQIL